VSKLLLSLLRIPVLLSRGEDFEVNAGMRTSFAIVLVPPALSFLLRRVDMMLPSFPCLFLATGIFRPGGASLPLYSQFFANFPAPAERRH